MTLRNRILSVAAPIVIAVVWDTVCLAARVMGLYKTFEENAAMFNGAEAMRNLEEALAEHMAWQAEQERKAA